MPFPCRPIDTIAPVRHRNVVTVEHARSARFYWVCLSCATDCANDFPPARRGPALRRPRGTGDCSSSARARQRGAIARNAWPRPAAFAPTLRRRRLTDDRLGEALFASNAWPRHLRRHGRGIARGVYQLDGIRLGRGRGSRGHQRQQPVPAGIVGLHLVDALRPIGRSSSSAVRLVLASISCLTASKVRTPVAQAWLMVGRQCDHCRSSPLPMARRRRIRAEEWWFREPRIQTLGEEYCDAPTRLSRWTRQTSAHADVRSCPASEQTECSNRRRTGCNLRASSLFRYRASDRSVSYNSA